MSTVYHQVLEDLAAKRRAIDELIVSVARVAGIDAAPYLDRLPAVTDADVDDVVDRLRETATPPKETPPRPQRPASPSTNGTRANKVQAKHAAHQARILEALKKPLRPVSPSELAKELKWSLPKLRKHIQPLVTSGQVKAAGVTSGRTFELR